MMAAISAAAFQGRNVFLTGHTGFKGSWLAIWLHSLRAKVYGYSLPPPTDPSNFVASQVEGLLVRHTIGDVRDAKALKQALSDARPEIIFHLAAQPLVRLSYQIPTETFEVNVLGVANLLDAVRELKLKCAIAIVTSDKCYSNDNAGRAFRETDPLGGHDPYSASKAAAEILIASYRHSFFIPEKIAQHGVKLCSVRAGNVIGGGDWAKDRIVTDVVAALQKGEAVPVRNPKAIRPWQHVLEPLSGYLLLAQRMLASNDASLCSAWNFGPAANDDLCVEALVKQFCEQWGGGKFYASSDPKAQPEATMLRLDICKATTELGWRPRWNAPQAVAQTIAWYKEYFSKPQNSLLAQCKADLAAYDKSAAQVLASR